VGTQGPAHYLEKCNKKRKKGKKKKRVPERIAIWGGVRLLALPDAETGQTVKSWAFFQNFKNNRSHAKQ